jgi:hypothetical protein
MAMEPGCYIDHKCCIWRHAHVFEALQRHAAVDHGRVKNRLDRLVNLLAGSRHC